MKRKITLHCEGARDCDCHAKNWELFWTYAVVSDGSFYTSETVERVLSGMGYGAAVEALFKANLKSSHILQLRHL